MKKPEPTVLEVFDGLSEPALEVVKSNLVAVLRQLRMVAEAQAMLAVRGKPSEVRRVKESSPKRGLDVDSVVIRGIS